MTRDTGRSPAGGVLRRGAGPVCGSAGRRGSSGWRPAVAIRSAAASSAARARRAPCSRRGPGNRIRCAKDTGLRNLPLHGFAQNQIWCEIVALASDLLAWTAMLALTGPARRWEPRRLRLRLFSAAGRLVRGGRRLRLRLSAVWPWAPDITAAFSRLQALTPG